MKLMFIDVETTGTDPSRHAIIQLAGQIWVGGSLKKAFNWRMWPRGKEITEEAVRVTGISAKQMLSYPPSSHAIEAFIHILGEWVSAFDRHDKFFLVGFQANFDASFIRQWFLDHGNNFFGSYFWHPPIDVAQLAMFHLLNRRPRMIDFRLESVAGELGIEFEGTSHDAVYDVEVTRKIWEKITRGGRIETIEG